MPKNKIIGLGHHRLTPPITIEKLDQHTRKRLALISKEFTKGYALIRKYKKSVSIFGSSTLSKNNPYCKKATRLAAKIAQAGYAVITGGGPGIMEAANKGAFAAGGASIGLNIKLPHEQHLNKYLTDQMEFHYFFSRKVMLAFAAEAYLFFPGGYGTLDEFFEIATLVQTNRMVKVPMILVGKKFWQPLNSLINEGLLAAFHTIDPHDPKLYHIEDDEKKILKIIKRVPIIETIPFKRGV